MQMAVCEYARNVAKIEGAQSAEFDEHAEHKVIDLMPDQEQVQDKGGTMRLGAYECKIVPSTLASRVYGQSRIFERHRHRYEFNNAYREELQSAGLKLSGLSPDGSLVEIVELSPDEHPFFLGCQFHPEFRSRPTAPHPLFSAYVGAALAYQREQT
jgi:CTP synthase